MIETIVGAILAALGTTAIASPILAAAITGVLYIGTSLGLSLLSSLFYKKPDYPKPDDVQQQTKNAIAPRYRHYGRVKASGNWVFANTESGNFHKVLAIGQGPVDGIEEFWVDDYQVTRNATTGLVTTGVPVDGDNKEYANNVRIFYRLGTGTDTAYSELTSAFSSWTSDHRGRGIVSLYATQFAVGQNDYMSLFPSGINTNYRVVMRGVPIENPVTYAMEWDDNSASIIRDYLYHEDGLRLPKSLLMTPLAIAGWQTAFNKCNVEYALKAGGTEPRYRSWGTYSLEEKCADVLNRMLLACDGRLMITPDAGLTLDIGDIPENLVVIDDSMIVGFSELGRGYDIMATANTIRATYTSPLPADDYQSTDADPWVDAADVSLRGELATSYEYPMVPSHSQCRRLMKLAAYRSNPEWVGQFTCNVKALRAFGERYCRIVFPAFGLDEVFEIQNFNFNFGENGILETVTMQVNSMPAEAYEWDATQEEGDAPDNSGVGTIKGIPVPTNFTASIFRKEVNGQFFPYALLSFDPAPSAALVVEAQGKLVSESNWTPIAVSTGATEAQSFLLTDGAQYEFQVRYRSLSAGDWTSSVLLTAVADPTAPGVIKSLVVTGGVGKVNTSWQSPNSANFSATNIRRNTTNNESTATLVRTEYGAANFPFTWTNTPLAAGTYYYWFKARNASGVESASVASGPITVT